MSESWHDEGEIDMTVGKHPNERNNSKKLLLFAMQKSFNIFAMADDDK